MGRSTRLSSPRAFALSRLVAAASLSGAAIFGLAVPAAAAAPSERAAQQSDTSNANGNAENHGPAAEPQGNAYGLDKGNAAVDAPAAKQDDAAADRGAKDSADKPGLAKGQSQGQKAAQPSSATPAKQPATSSASHTCSSRTVGNGGGANGSGAYGSTCDGSASQNGNGGGTAGGKPCAGCVGSADDKNPPGQRPNGSDHNAGYECDRNHGVGRGNPAHSACTTVKTVPPTTVPPTTVPPTTVPPTTKPPKKSLPVIDAQVAGIGTARTPELVAQAASPATPAGGLLAMTGLELSMLVTLGSAALGGGGIAFAIRRRIGK